MNAKNRMMTHEHRHARSHDDAWLMNHPTRQLLNPKSWDPKSPGRDNINFSSFSFSILLDRYIFVIMIEQGCLSGRQSVRRVVSAATSSVMYRSGRTFRAAAMANHSRKEYHYSSGYTRLDVQAVRESVGNGTWRKRLQPKCERLRS